MSPTTSGVGARVKPDEEATQRVAGEDVGSSDASGNEQCVKVDDSIRGGPRLGDRIAAAGTDVAIQGGYGPRSIISANSCETGHARENHRPWRSCLAEVA